jgi:hypothetical protein
MRKKLPRFLAQNNIDTGLARDDRRDRLFGSRIFAVRGFNSTVYGELGRGVLVPDKWAEARSPISTSAPWPTHPVIRQL